jgi:hypothetical protein
MAARALLAGLAFLLAAASPAAAERRVALVVGNAAYREAPLRNPANDARAMAEALRRAGFEVLLRQNLTKPQLERAIAEFGDKLASGGDAVGLFFYAGHGMQLRGRNYLIPVDAQIVNEQRVRIETVDVDLVLEQMQAANARVSVAILDACRNNPFERRFRSVGGGLAQMDAPEGTLIAYATAPGTVAADGEGENGIYTAELLKAITRPGLKIEDVFKQTRAGVARASGNAQVPWESSSLTGDFYFVAPLPGVAAAAAPAAAPATAAPPPVPRSELQAWEAVKDTARTAELEAFIDEFPDGPFAPLARVRIMDIVGRASAAPRAVAPAPPLEGRFWTTIPTELVANRLGEIQLTVNLKEGRITGGGVTRRNQICRAVGLAAARGAILRLDVTCDGQPAASFVGGRFPDEASHDPALRSGWMRARTVDEKDTIEVTWETVK